MKGNHFHISVRDLETTLSWFERVWQLIPTHKGKTFAVLPFGSMQLVIDASNEDSLATLGFDSENCDRDCQAVINEAPQSSSNLRTVPGASELPTSRDRQVSGWRSSSLLGNSRCLKRPKPDNRPTDRPDATEFRTQCLKAMAGALVCEFNT